MALRFDDAARTLSLSVRDLVEACAPSGHLVLEVVQGRVRRLVLGQQVHRTWQEARHEEDAGFASEVRVRHQVAVGAWTVTVHGRVDGLAEEDGRAIVEEVKSTALDASRLYRTRREDWPEYAAQLEIYLWMLGAGRHVDPVGRLVLVSLHDGVRHVLGVELDRERTGALVRERLEHLVREREERIAWLADRRARVVPAAFDAWRPGQEDIAAGVSSSLVDGRQVLVQAPTGLGKTAAVLDAVLRWSLANDRQVFWATARNTQQAAVEAALARLAERGLPLRVLTLGSKERVCLNDVVDCRPEVCRFAANHFDKLAERGSVARAVAAGALTVERVRVLAREDEVCPYALAAELTGRFDVVIGDYNYVFDPAVRLGRHFGEGEAHGWVVVVDEAHQLVERARGYGSPEVSAAAARAALASLDAPVFAPFAALAREVEYRVLKAAELAEGPFRDGVGLASPSAGVWRELADRVEEVGLDYALLRADRPVPGPDPWVELARAVLRFARVLDEAGDETARLVDANPGAERVRLACLDPSRWLGPQIGGLGGFVGTSATLRPVDYHSDLLGLGRLDVVDVPCAFPPENRRVVVVPRISTAYKDRAAQAEPTAALMARCIEAVPGNVAAYFSSFAMLDDIVSRWSLDRELLAQRPGMGDDERRAMLARLSAPGRVVLAAVLGGVFAEGVDLPAGALAAVLVAGPALPPVGLERDLLRGFCEERYGDGFRYASLVPGMTRVVQAAGRLVRRPDDRGVVVLLDRRFRWRDYAALLPPEWDVTVPDDPVAEIAGFFQA